MIPVVSEDDDTNVVSLEVECHAPNARPELDHFSGLDLVEADHTGNTVTDADDSAEFLDVVDLGDVHDLFLDDLGSFSDAQLLGEASVKGSKQALHIW